MKEVISAGSYLKEKIDSKEWWVIPILDKAQNQYMTAFENHFYVPEKTALFELLSVFNFKRGLICFGFGHKSIARPRAVAAWLRKETGRNMRRKDLEARDILVMCPETWGEDTFRVITEGTLSAIRLIMDDAEPMTAAIVMDPPAGQA